VPRGSHFLFTLTVLQSVLRVKSLFSRGAPAFLREIYIHLDFFFSDKTWTAFEFCCRFFHVAARPGSMNRNRERVELAEAAAPGYRHQTSSFTSHFRRFFGAPPVDAVPCHLAGYQRPFHVLSLRGRCFAPLPFSSLLWHNRAFPAMACSTTVPLQKRFLRKAILLVEGRGRSTRDLSLRNNRGRAAL